MTQTCHDPVILNQWHPLTSLDEIAPGLVHDTLLLDMPVSYALDPERNAQVWRRSEALPAQAPFDPAGMGDPLPAKVEHGYLWTSVGDPPDAIFTVPEMLEQDRKNVPTGFLG